MISGFCAQCHSQKSKACWYNNSKHSCSATLTSAWSRSRHCVPAIIFSKGTFNEHIGWLLLLLAATYSVYFQLGACIKNMTNRFWQMFTDYPEVHYRPCWFWEHKAHWCPSQPWTRSFWGRNRISLRAPCKKVKDNAGTSHAEASAAKPSDRISCSGNNNPWTNNLHKNLKPSDTKAQWTHAQLDLYVGWLAFLLLHL